MAAVGVNKASDQFVVLNEQTAAEAASGRYRKQPGQVGPAAIRPGTDDARGGGPAPEVVPRSSGRSTSRPWTQVQENLALTYRDMGLSPDAIARKLGIGRGLVTRILLSAPRRR